MRFVLQILVVVALGYQELTSRGVYGIPDCRAKLDLVIILDSSLSVGLRNFRKVTAFIQSLIGHLPVHSDGVRVSVVRYASDAKVISYLDEHTSKKEKLALVHSMAYKTGATFTHVALELTRKSVLVPERGDRPDVPNLIILTTDGVSKNQTLTQREASALKENHDLKIFVIGIGKEVVDGELVNAASRPEMVYKLTDFSQLTDIVDRLAKFSCSDMEESSISDLQTGLSSNSAIISFGGTKPSIYTSLQSRQPVTATFSLKQTVQTTLQTSRPRHTWKSTVVALPSQSKLEQQFSKSIPWSKTEIVNIETTAVVNNVRTETSSPSTLLHETNDLNRNIANKIVHSNLTIATQSRETVSVTKQTTVTEVTKLHVTVTPTENSTASSHKQPISRTFPTDLSEVSTNSSQSTRPETTMTVGENKYQNYSQSQVTEMFVHSTAEISKTAKAESNLTETTSTQSYFADSNTTVGTASRILNVTRYRTVKPNNTSDNFTSVQTEATIVTNSTSTTDDITLLHNMTSTVNIPTLKLATYPTPTLVTNKTTDVNTETLDRYTSVHVEATDFLHQLSTVNIPKLHLSTGQRSTIDTHTLRVSTNQPSTLSTDQSPILNTSIFQLLNETATVSTQTTKLSLIQTSTPTSRDTNQTKYTQTVAVSKHAMQSKRTLAVSSTTLSARETTVLDKSQKFVSPSATIDNVTLSLGGDIVKEINNTMDDSEILHGQHGGTISSRDLYIFVAGGSAVAFILAAAATFIGVLCRRRKGNTGVDVSV